jgi:hypothetical protein
VPLSFAPGEAAAATSASYPRSAHPKKIHRITERKSRYVRRPVDTTLFVDPIDGYRVRGNLRGSLRRVTKR